MTELTPKQHRFCQEYMVDFNATKAAQRAGYSEKTAYSQGQRLLKNVEIKARIAALQDEARERTNVSIDDVIAMLLDCHKDAKAAKQLGPAVRAVELLGKRLGMFKDRVEFSELQAMTDEELAAGLAKQCGGGDRDLERRIYRNILKPVPPHSFEPRPVMSDDEIDRLLDGARLH